MACTYPLSSLHHSLCSPSASSQWAPDRNPLQWRARLSVCLCVRKPNEEQVLCCPHASPPSPSPCFTAVRRHSKNASKTLSCFSCCFVTRSVSFTPPSLLLCFIFIIQLYCCSITIEANWTKVIKYILIQTFPSLI